MLRPLFKYPEEFSVVDNDTYVENSKGVTKISNNSISMSLTNKGLFLKYANGDIIFVGNQNDLEKQGK